MNDPGPQRPGLNSFDARQAIEICMMDDILKDDEYNTDRQVSDHEADSMGHSQADKAQSRNRILKEAAAQIRQSGLESISLATLMKKANLTHGGFYGHFDSRSNLLAAALERALIEGEAAARAHAAPDRPRSFATMVRSYLSRTHRDNRHAGCAIASLAVDVARADEETRGVMAPHIEKAIAKIRDALGDRTEDRAIVAMSAMVGAMALSRVMTDPKRSDALLRATRDYLLDMQQDPPT